MKKIFSRLGLLLLTVVMVGMFGASYAGYTDILTSEVNLSTGSMGFEFLDLDESEGFLIGIQEGEKGAIRKLDANVEYDGQSLTITDMEAIDMSLLEKGDLRILIRYAIKAEDEQSIRRAAAIDEEDEKNNVIGEIPFELLSKTPLWSINGKSESRGLGDQVIETVPEIIYMLLPETLGTFEASQILSIDEKEDRMQGMIILEQIEPLKLLESLSDDQIYLSEFGLTKENLGRIAEQDDLELSVQGCYGFKIPLILDQFNAERRE